MMKLFLNLLAIFFSLSTHAGSHPQHPLEGFWISDSPEAVDFDSRLGKENYGYGMEFKGSILKEYRTLYHFISTGSLPETRKFKVVKSKKGYPTKIRIQMYRLSRSIKWFSKDKFRICARYEWGVSNVCHEMTRLPNGYPKNWTREVTEFPKKIGKVSFFAGNELMRWTDDDRRASVFPGNFSDQLTYWYNTYIHSTLGKMELGYYPVMIERDSTNPASYAYQVIVHTHLENGYAIVRGYTFPLTEYDALTETYSSHRKIDGVDIRFEMKLQ